MKKDPTVFVKHILQSIEAVEKYLEDVSENDFYESAKTQDAVVRRIEIIGEATKNLPNEFKEKYPDIPWKDMAGMRDKIVRQYFGINFNRVWDTAKRTIPELKKQIEEILRDYSPKEKS